MARRRTACNLKNVKIKVKDGADQLFLLSWDHRDVRTVGTGGEMGAGRGGWSLKAKVFEVSDEIEGEGGKEGEEVGNRGNRKRKNQKEE